MESIQFYNSTFTHEVWYEIDES